MNGIELKNARKAMGIKPSPNGGKELLVVTDDPDAIKHLRSLNARFAPRHGFFINPARARIFEALMEASAVSIGDRSYRFPDGTVRDIYQSTRYIRQVLGRRVIA